MAEVVKHVPVNSILSSELKREQSPGNGPWREWWGLSDQQQSSQLSLTFTSSRGNVLKILVNEAWEGRGAFYKGVIYLLLYTHGV